MRHVGLEAEAQGNRLCLSMSMAVGCTILAWTWGGGLCSGTKLLCWYVVCGPECVTPEGQV